MPELPEVENIVRKLGPVVSGKTIEDITVFRDKSFQGEADLVLGLPIESVSRRAKFIRFHFPGNQNILSHLKMTGQFIYVDNENRVGGGHPTADWVKELPSRHTRVQLSLSGNATLFFNDQRVFGWLRVLADPEVEALYGKYGPDINTPAASIEYLANKFARTSRPVKIALMDNSIICGVGNIYACDALNLAGISPLRPANSLSLSEIEKLLQSAKQVIDLGIKTGGATIDNYVNLDGFAGSYQNHLQVYGREGEKCYQCGGVIEKIKLGGRGTYYCPHCQV
jgi:formamidopyrimidine-DNA glycosylase